VKVILNAGLTSGLFMKHKLPGGSFLRTNVNPNFWATCLDNSALRFEIFFIIS
jgi:hypothetical protein